MDSPEPAAVPPPVTAEITLTVNGGEHRLAVDTRTPPSL